MLSQEEKKEIDKEIAAVPYKKSASIEAMKIIQRHRGWLSDDSLVELAEYMGRGQACYPGM
jgi:NADH-quinone oxidoreductase subunit E